MAKVTDRGQNSAKKGGTGAKRYRKGKKKGVVKDL